MKDHILIVDDETDLLKGLDRLISGEIDCETFLACNGREAREIMEKEPIDVVLADVRMPDMDGMELLREIRKVDQYVTVILMTAYGTVELAVKAIKDGAYDFIRKPFDEEQIIHVLRKGLERNRLLRENARLSKKLCDQEPFENMIGQSACMHKVFDTIRMLARTDVTVLILGESGTGKELAARAIHDTSKRRAHSMVTVNCPALPDGILESELFGYRKGAFTNALHDKSGLFEEARDSTIFLDEIGDLPLSLQAKLLRVLQEKEIRRLGDNKPYGVDVRIIASTNQDLKNKMEEGEFREDLYYRLNVASIVMPPLRERQEDIPLLVEHFLNKSSCEFGIEQKKITPEAIDCLMQMDWPGNVRELENSIRGTVAVAPGPVIEIDMLPYKEPTRGMIEDQPDFSQSYKFLKNAVVKEFTLRYITGLLQKTRGNISLAAQMSGIKRQSLQKIIKRYRIEAENFRA